MLARENPDVNDAWICDKGRFAFHHDDAAGRITTPLVRDHGLEPTSFGEALTAVADACRGARVGVIAGGRLLDEDAYALSKLARTVLRHQRPGPPACAARRVGRAAAPRRRRRASRIATSSAPRRSWSSGLDAEQEVPILHLRLRKAATRGARIVVVASAPHAPARRRRARARAVPARRPPRSPRSRRAPTRPAWAPRWRPPASAGSSLRARGSRSTTAPPTRRSPPRRRTARGSRWIPRRAGDRGALARRRAPGVRPGRPPPRRGRGARRDRGRVGARDDRRRRPRHDRDPAGRGRASARRALPRRASTRCATPPTPRSRAARCRT